MRKAKEESECLVLFLAGLVWLVYGLVEVNKQIGNGRGAALITNLKLSPKYVYSFGQSHMYKYITLCILI